MKAIVQRVEKASVDVENAGTRSIGPGLMVLLGVARGDTREDAEYLIRKITGMRIFKDSEGRMNKSVMDIEGEVLVVSQFTLMAATRKGNRPSFDPAAPPEEAKPLYETFLNILEDTMGRRPAVGEFGAYMKVSLVNDGPVTIPLDSRAR